jgi:hypothetical protein
LPSILLKTTLPDTEVVDAAVFLIINPAVLVDTPEALDVSAPLIELYPEVVADPPVPN